MAETLHRSFAPGKLDYNKAKILAYIVVAGFMAILFVFGLRSSGQPETYDGDRTESLTCPVCQGTGLASGSDSDKRCAVCLGSKKLKAVIPGPLHPVNLRGTVRDLGAFKDEEDAQQSIAADALDRTKTLRVLKGAVANAELTFVGSDGLALETTSKATGRFWGSVDPGDYKVKIKAVGFPETTREVTVPPRAEPIWPSVVDDDIVPAEVFQQDFLLSK